MNRNQFVILAAIAVMAGFIGGAIATRVFPPQRTAFGEFLDFLAMVSSEQPVPALYAEKFLLVDGDGNTGASLAFSDEGNPLFCLYHKTGDPALAIGVAMPDTIQLILTLSNKDGECRAIFGLGSDGEPGLAMYDKDFNAIWEAP